MKSNILLTLTLLSLISACSTPLPKDQTPIQTTQKDIKDSTEPDPKYIVLNTECAKLAKYARSAALLRDAGTKIEDVSLLIKDYPAELPVSAVNREVFTRKDISPDNGQKNVYEVCKNKGYESIISALISAEKKYNEEEAERIKSLISNKKKTKKTYLSTKKDK